MTYYHDYGDWISFMNTIFYVLFTNGHELSAIDNGCLQRTMNLVIVIDNGCSQIPMNLVIVIDNGGS